MNDRTPPHEDAAEQAVLGALMTTPDAVEQIGTLKPSDFYSMQHEWICDAILTLHRTGKPADPVSLGNELRARGQLVKVGNLAALGDLLSAAPALGGVSHHATIVRDLAGQRRLIDQATANLHDAWDSFDSVEAKVQRAEERLRSVPVGEPENATTVMSLDEFLDQPIPETDWVIPGLMARGERLVLTGQEGLGKSVLMRQFAVCAAAGVHPFTFAPIPKQTALFVDAENPTRIMVGSFGMMRDAIRRNRGGMDGHRLWIERRPAGMNLGDPADVLWLQRLVSLVNPDLLCIGPAYKLFRGTAKDREEDLARQVTTVLDAVRASVNCALILEHHAGHATSSQGRRDMRPRGSSLWLAWPEFGFGISAAEGSKKDDRIVDCVPWRGDREARDWPEQLASGTNFMPWIDARNY